ncbi:DUF6434 domain-containing protein [Candidatus Enterococcus murrayae]|uniref:SAP domain-containing protein n=1 Tax=Candidatus Enterococcus murrayae TaxID=2815321 RepID=A0ABS3HFA4_9ENTE|nr:hypothetical protein [Enterococcus sp. MJM16]
MTEKRPELKVGLKPDAFLDYYYLKAELQLFCQEQGLVKSGSKAELNQRIEHFLRTGQRLTAVNEEQKAVRTEEITLNSLIEENIVCSEKHRTFFRRELGETFSFKVAFQKWLKSNAGKTYREAVEVYSEIAAKKPEKIDSQFEYNTYIRDFFADNQGRSLQEAIVCWKYKRALPGDNKYHAADLKALETC